MKTLVVVGTGAHARKAFHCAQAAGWRVVAFADENPAATAPVAGLDVQTVDQALAAPAAGTAAPAVFVAIGNADVRRRLMDRAEAAGRALPALVHPHAWVAPDARLAAGVIVAAGAVVESGCDVGRGAIVDVGVVLDHDCTVAGFAHVRGGAVRGPGAAVPP